MSGARHRHEGVTRVSRKCDDDGFLPARWGDFERTCPVPGTAGEPRCGEAAGTMCTDIRGRPGLDVVDSPAELQAEVAGWPRKSTGKPSKCEEQSRTRCLTSLGNDVASSWARGSGSGANERARRGGSANRPKRDTKGWLARRLVGCQPAGGRISRAA